MRTIIAAIFCSTLLVHSEVSAQSASVAARQFFQAYTDKQWFMMAGVVDSTSLVALRGMGETMVRNFAAASRPAAKAAMDSTGMAKTMEGLQAMFGGGSMLRLMFANVTDEAQFKALSDRELMARWFEAKSLAYLTTVMAGGMLGGMMDKVPGSAVEIRSEMDRMAQQRQAWQVVGEIMEGDSIAHVTYRVVGEEASAAGVLTFKASRGVWKIHFTSPDDQLVPMTQLAMRAAQAGMKR
jgi:hypothetical protein